MKNLTVGINTPTLIAAGIAALVALYLLSKAKSAGAAVVEAINPISQNNVVNKATNSVFQAIYNPGADPRRTDTVGTWIGGWFDDYDPNADVPEATLPRSMRTGALQLK